MQYHHFNVTDKAMTEGNDKKPWVTASQIGQAAYCPYQLYLQTKGAPLSNRTHSSLAKGTAKHQEFNREIQDEFQRSSQNNHDIKIITLIILVVLVIILMTIV
jgi:hypothetical protein